MSILISIYISIPFKNDFFSLQNKLFFFFHCFNLSPFLTHTKYSDMTSHSLSQHPSQIITYPANKEIKPPKQSSVCQNPSIKTLTPRSTQALPKLICLVWSSYLLFLCFKFTFESIFMSIWVQAYYACSKLVSTCTKGLGHGLLACAALTCS